jgi:hypothetical protein
MDSTPKHYASCSSSLCLGGWEFKRIFVECVSPHKELGQELAREMHPQNVPVSTECLCSLLHYAEATYVCVCVFVLLGDIKLLHKNWPTFNCT